MSCGHSLVHQTPAKAEDPASSPTPAAEPPADALAGETPLQEQAVPETSTTPTPDSQPSRSRLQVERVALIAAISLPGGLAAGRIWGYETLFMAVIVGFLMSSVYVAGTLFLGLPGYFEKVPVDEVVPVFDWGRLRREAIAFGVALAAVVLVSGVMALFRWANGGGHK